MTLALDHLNKAQYEAVTSSEGPHLINAGPGAGKTRVLTYRIATLLQAKKALPWQILALTFTNRAAAEMQHRIKALIGTAAEGIWSGTFHAICCKILRIEHQSLGISNQFSIYDRQDSLKLIKQILKAQNLSEEQYKPAVVIKRISSAKALLIDATTYQKSPTCLQEDKQANKPKMAEIYLLYQQRCLTAQALDFDDLLLKTYQLFARDPKILEKWQTKFKYILVDEFQDTNKIQNQLLTMLAAKHHNLCVIGDDAQSIYAFRGAKIDNILSFTRVYPKAKVTQLEENYRSEHHIVGLASSLIRHNTGQLPKQIFTNKKERGKVIIKQNANEIEEAQYVAESIFTAHQADQLPYDQFAILYRTHAQSRIFEEHLRKIGIPYRLLGGLSFYARKEIKDLLAYWRLLVNPSDWGALERVINLPKRGVGQVTLDKISSYSRTHQIPYWQALKELLAGLPTQTRSKLTQFIQLIETATAQLKPGGFYQPALETLQATGLLKTWHNDQSPEGVSRYDNVQELLSTLKNFEHTHPEKGLAAFLQEVALSTDLSQDQSGASVTLATIHAVKGLEYTQVFVVGLEQGIFPSFLSLDSKEELEEERRLLYVAITRAKKKLSLSYALSRFRYGKQMVGHPSIFLKELDGAHTTYQGAHQLPDRPKKNTPRAGSHWGRSTTPLGAVKKRSGIQQPTPRKRSGADLTPLHKLPPKSVDPSAFAIGMRITHQRFGQGSITALSGSGRMQKAQVNFDQFGSKTLLIHFAKLTP